MTIKDAVYDFLIADAGINTAVGGRVFYGRVPQGQPFPAIVLQVITTNHNYHLTNESTVVDPTIQVDIYDKGTTGQQSVIAGLVRSRLSGYRGALNNDIFCDSSTILRDSEFYTKPTDGTDNWINRVSIDFRIFHFQTAPAH